MRVLAVGVGLWMMGVSVWGQTAYNVTGGGSYCTGGAGLPVGLQDSEVGYNYQLYLNGSPSGSPISGTGETISFGNQTAAGTYTVQVGSVPMTGSVQITINPLLPVSVSISASATTICEGASVTFTATNIVNGGTAPSFQWQVNGTNVGSNSDTYSTSSLTNGQAAQLLMISNAVCANNPASSNTVTMTVNPLSLTSVSVSASSNNICPDTSVTFTAAPVNGGSNPAYQWRINGTPAGTNSSTFTSSALANGDQVTVEMTSNATCPSPSTATITPVIMSVYPGTPSTPGTITGSSIQCPNVAGLVYSIAAVPDATTYTWSVPAGWIITSGNGTNSIIVTSGAAGQNGNITVTAGNNCGTSNASSLAVTAGSLSANPGGAANRNRGTWTTSGSGTSGTDPVVAPVSNTTGIFEGLTPGVYEVTVSNSDGCNSEPASFTVNVQPPTPEVSVTSPAVCEGTPATVTATPLPAGNYNYTWTVPSGVNDPGSVASFQTSVAGTYSVVITDPISGCASEPASADLTINSSITPLFTQLGPLPLNSIPPALPLISENGITGTWNPSAINTGTPGTTTYTFIPDPDQYALPVTMNIFISAPALTVVKTQTSTEPITTAGQIITYQIVITNNGNIPVTGAVATELYPGSGLGTLSTVIESISANSILDVGETWTHTATYTATQLDIDHGTDLVNTFSLTSNEVPGPVSDDAVTPVVSNATLDVVNVAEEATYSHPNDVIHYTIVVTNTGNVTITNVTVTDPLTGLNETIPSLAPGENHIYNQQYRVTQVDIDAESVVNTARARGTYNNTPVEDSDDETVLTEHKPAIDLVKSGTYVDTNSDGIFNPGDQITYIFAITNTGNVTLSNITLIDPSITVNGVPIPTLDPGASDNTTFSGTYILTQADIDAGTFTNTATATGRFRDDQYSDTDSDTQNFASSQNIELLKDGTYNDTDGNGICNPGDQITYRFTVINNGNVTLTNVTVTDNNPQVIITGTPIVSLAPGQTNNTAYTGVYTLTQADINAGIFSNTATASGIYNNVANTDTDDDEQRLTRIPEISTVKTFTDINGNPALTQYSSLNDVINYTITVQNTGNVTITQVSVSDNNADAASVYSSGDTNGNGIMEVGETWTYTAYHTVDQNDLNNGSVRNIAAASGQDPEGQPVTDNSNEVIIYMNLVSQIELTKTGTDDDTQALTALPGIKLEKTGTYLDNDPVGTYNPGDRITYEFTVRNTGNVTLTGVTIDDPIADVTCANDPFTLAPGAQVTCTGQHIVTPADVAAGRIRNVASVTGRDPGMGNVTAISNEVIVTLNNMAPSISCPRPIITNTSATTCDILINEGLAAMYSDPNDNVVTLTWVMTGATTASSPSDGINNLTSYTFNRGLTTVTYTVTDALGLSASCSFTVSVVDNTRPTAICQDITVTLDINTGIATITVEDIDNGSYDNCAVALMTISKDEFNCTDIGLNSVVLTVIDESGNISTCTANVTVNYADLGIRVTPAEDVICNGAITGLIMSSNAPATTWTWTVSPSREITGASDDNTGLNSVITQTLFNTDNSAHNVIYNIVPTVYGLCMIPSITAEVWVNPTPQIEVNPHESVICYGESITLNVRNLNGMVQGQWVYDVRVVPDPGIDGFTPGATYTTPVSLTETLTNSGTERHKVEYHFTPRIVPSDGGADCIGEEQVITIWVHPRIQYTSELSNYNGYNISCYGKSNGYIRLELSPNLAPYTFSWKGPDGFSSSTEDISELKVGEYTVTITDVNNCSTSETFVLTEPNKLSMTIEKSVSLDGDYNINCFGGQTGYANISPVNNVGSVDYLWADGNIGSKRQNMSAGTYKIILTDSNNCHADSTVNLTQPDPIKIVFEKIDPFCPDSRDGEITPSVSGGISGGDYLYRWPDNSTGRVLSQIPAGWYALSVTDMNTCTVTDSVRLIGMNEFCLIIPDAISPNRDLINDVWNIENIDLYPNVVITIYNRWGQVLWESDPGYPVPWNGRSRHEELPIDSYHYVIDLHNGMKPIVGVVTIVK